MSSIYRDNPTLLQSDSELTHLIRVPVHVALLNTGDPVLDAYFGSPPEADRDVHLSQPNPSEIAGGTKLISGSPEQLGFRWAILETLDYLGWESGKHSLNCDHIWNRQRWAQDWFKELDYSFSAEDALFLLNFHACRFPGGYGQAISWTLAPWHDFNHVVEKSSVEDHPAFLQTVRRIVRLADAEPDKQYYEGTKLLLERCCEYLGVDFATTNFAAIETSDREFVESHRKHCVSKSGRFFQKLLEEEPNKTKSTDYYLSNYDRHLTAYYKLSPHEAGAFFLDAIRCDIAKRCIEVEGQKRGVNVETFDRFGFLPPMFTNVFGRMETDLQNRKLAFTKEQAFELLQHAHHYPWRDFLEAPVLRAALDTLDPSDPKHVTLVKSYQDAQFGDNLQARARKHTIDRYLGYRVPPVSLAVMGRTLQRGYNRICNYFGENSVHRF